MVRRRKREQPREGMVDISSLLEGALQQLGVQGDFEKHRVEKKCREVLGEKFSKALTGVELKKGTVQMEFNHSIWMQEANLRKIDILKKLQQALPDVGIKNLKFGLSRSKKS